MNVLTKLRLKLLGNGYTPLANHDKRCFLQHWQDIVVTAEMIRKWARNRYEATGLRLENGLVMLDVDAGMRVLVDRLAGEAERILPGLFDRGLVRFSAGGREAWFCRVEGQPFTRLASRLWMKPGEDPDGTGETYRLEVFGGSRQAGAFGPHRIDENGKVLSEYSWDKLSPADLPLADLPAYTPEPFGQLCDAFDRIAEELGLVAVAPARHTDDPTVLYVLEPDTVIELMDGSSATVAELETYAPELRSGEYLRCSGLFHSPDRVRRDSHTIAMGRHGIGIFDFQDGVTYCRRDAEPPAAMAISAETISALAAMQARAKPEPEPDDAAAPHQAEPDARDESEPAKGAEPEAVLEFLLRNYAVDRHAGKIVDLRATNRDGAFMDLNVFHMLYAEFRFYRPPRPRKDGKESNAEGKWAPVTQTWMVHPDHVKVHGTRFKPGLPFPLYEDGGRLYKNTYRKPRHAGEASLEPLWAFLEVFIPDEATRNYRLDALAHHWAHPDVPGPSFIYVGHGADDSMMADYGTGRSTWFDFQARLFGRDYVRNEDFNVITGASGQSDYTSYKADRILLTIDEAKTRANDNNFKGDYAAYESLKSVADPAPRWRTFKIKYGQPFEDWDYAALEIATNHNDLHIPPGDRRFCVVANGRPLTMQEARAFNEWARQPGAAAALAAWCDARDTSKFNPYAPPPVFDAKAHMQEKSRSDMDQVFAGMRQQFGLLFTKAQARAFAWDNIDTPAEHHDPRTVGRFEAAFRQHCSAIPKGADYLRVRLKRAATAQAKALGQLAGGVDRQERVFTFFGRRIGEFSQWGQDDVRAECLKSMGRLTFTVIDGGPGTAGGGSETAGGGS